MPKKKKDGVISTKWCVYSGQIWISLAKKYMKRGSCTVRSLCRLCWLWRQCLLSPAATWLSSGVEVKRKWGEQKHRRFCTSCLYCGPHPSLFLHFSLLSLFHPQTYKQIRKPSQPPLKLVSWIVQRILYRRHQDVWRGLFVICLLNLFAWRSFCTSALQAYHKNKHSTCDSCFSN